MALPQSASESDQGQDHISAIVLVVTGVSCTLSMIGSWLIIYTYFKWRPFQNRPREMLCFLSLADFAIGFSYFYGILRNFKDSTWECISQSYISTLANLASIFWTWAVTIYLFIVLVAMNRTLADKLLLYFHAACWGVAVLITSIAAGTGSLGYGGTAAGRVTTVGWCWINIQHHYFLPWMLVTGIIWEIISFIILPFMSILVHINIKRQVKMYHELPADQQSNLNYLMKVDDKLTLLPLVFVVLRVWGTIRFFLFLTGSPLSLNQILLVLHGIGSSLQGGINCLIFCFLTKKVREKLLPVLCCRVPPSNTTLGATTEEPTPDVSTRQSEGNQELEHAPLLQQENVIY